jgi:hypothetical protein
LSIEQLRAVHGELPDRARAPHRDHVTGVDVAHLGAHVPRGQDVREEQDLLVREVGLDLERADVRERDPGVLGLPAREAAGEMGVAEDAGRRVAEHLLRQSRVGVGVLAHGIQFGAARGARPAGDRERDHDPVADPELAGVHAVADLDDLTHELVTHHVALLHRRHVAVDQVQVRPADRG